MLKVTPVTGFAPRKEGCYDSWRFLSERKVASLQTQRALLVFALCVSVCVAQKQPAPATPSAPSRDTYLVIAGEIRQALHRDVLGVWFPRTIDKEHSGYHSHFARDWQRLPSDGKFSVFQGRMVWVSSQVVLREPQMKEQFVPFVRQGVAYMANTLWDKKDGGFYWGLDDEGNITPQFTDHKHLYGIGFCIYGLAAAYQAIHDPQALDLAKQAFEWTDKHAHDSEHGGYFEWLMRDGTPVVPNAENGRVESNFVGPIGYKSMNTHIHLLEALTELYQVWPDPNLKARLEELLVIVRDKICVEPGVMNLYFTNNWQPIPDHDSYGHDVETAYLMLETDEALHGRAGAATERMARMLVDHALAYGWDANNGGLLREGTTFGKPEDTRKEWWVQVENLNALLMMHERYGRQNSVYFQRFLEQWRFIRDHTIDAQYRGLYNLTTAEGRPVSEDKGSIWKAAYHDGRAFWNVTERLHRLADPH
jgi:mannobiose 2-epimerase